MASLPDAQRVRNLRNEPHASLVITEDEGDRHGVVIVEGTTRLLQPLEAGLDMRAPFRDDEGNLPDWIGILVVLTPERLLTYARRVSPHDRALIRSNTGIGVKTPPL